MAQAAVPTEMAPTKSRVFTAIQQADKLEPLNNPRDIVSLRGSNGVI